MRTKVRGNTRTPNRLDFLAGDLIRAIPTDFAGESGANPTISIWDELWAYTRENLMRLWEEFTIVPTRPNSCRLVTTSAGFRDESELLWRLYQRPGRPGVRMLKAYELWGWQAGAGRRENWQSDWRTSSAPCKANGRNPSRSSTENQRSLNSPSR